MNPALLTVVCAPWEAHASVHGGQGQGPTTEPRDRLDSLACTVGENPTCWPCSSRSLSAVEPLHQEGKP